MWAAGVVDLGLSPTVFWNLTHHEFRLLHERYLGHQTRADWRAALIACTFANANRNHEKRPHPFTIEDFMPTPAMRDELASFKDLLERNSPERYIEKVKAADPESEIMFSVAALEAASRGQGRWDKLGTREGLMESAAVQEAIRKSRGH